MKKLKSWSILGVLLVSGFIWTSNVNVQAEISVNYMDFDNNYSIDIQDVASLAVNYNIASSNSKWDSKYDLNGDNIIDIYDLVKVSKEVGTTIIPDNKDIDKEYSFSTEALLNSHYQKHGSEFGNITKEEYLQSANELITSRSSDILTKPEEDGDMLYYCVSTNEFLVLSQDGYIRTYFKPVDGIKYYNRQ